MGNTFRVSDDDDEAESADYLVCIPAEPRVLFPDNVFDFCCKCGVKVQLRPRAPSAPKRICMVCVAPGIDRDSAKGELEVVVTTRTAAEVADYLRKRKVS